MTADCEIARQRAACRESAKKMGWDIVGEIEGFSVASPKDSQHTGNGLPQLGALSDLKNVDILLVFMFDRLIHNIEEIPTILEYFAHENAAVWGAMEGEIGGVDYADRLMHYISFWQDASGKQIDTIQNIKFKTCIINGQERYAFSAIDERCPMTEIPVQRFPKSLLSFTDVFRNARPAADH